MTRNQEERRRVQKIGEKDTRPYKSEQERGRRLTCTSSSSSTTTYQQATNYDHIHSPLIDTDIPAYSHDVFNTTRSPAHSLVFRPSPSQGCLRASQMVFLGHAPCVRYCQPRSTKAFKMIVDVKKNTLACALLALVRLFVSFQSLFLCFFFSENVFL